MTSIAYLDRLSSFLDRHTHRQKIALTLKELVRETNRGMKERAKRCKARYKGLDKKTMTWTYHVACSDGAAHGYIVKAKIVSEPWLGKKQKPSDFSQVDIQVSCTCPAWVYWGPERNSIVNEYNLPPLQGTGAPPKRNLYFRSGEPFTSALLCKHALETASHLLRQKIPWPTGWFQRLREKLRKVLPGKRSKRPKRTHVSSKSVVEAFLERFASEEDPSMMELYYAELLLDQEAEERQQI